MNGAIELSKEELATIEGGFVLGIVIIAGLIIIAGIENVFGSSGGSGGSSGGGSSSGGYGGGYSPTPTTYPDPNNPTFG